MTYQIKETREFYGPKKETGVLRDHFGDPLTFSDRAAAKAEIDRMDAEVYYLAHNESARPTYRIVKA
ncbi:hypothetical protein [Pseudooceanicola sp. MF1-13]|uniref:hypothetical protein n=1 Tax=Pseudooceanicola sp. MF1-13 TaxID=3379095 RepID=UPI003891F0B4